MKSNDILIDLNGLNLKSKVAIQPFKWFGDTCVVGNSNGQKLCATINEKNDKSDSTFSPNVGSGICVLGEQLLKM